MTELVPGVLVGDGIVVTACLWIVYVDVLFIGGHGRLGDGVEESSLFSPVRRSTTTSEGIANWDTNGDHEYTDMFPKWRMRRWGRSIRRSMQVRGVEIQRYRGSVSPAVPIDA